MTVYVITSLTKEVNVNVTLQEAREKAQEKANEWREITALKRKGGKVLGNFHPDMYLI